MATTVTAVVSFRDGTTGSASCQIVPQVGAFYWGITADPGLAKVTAAEVVSQQYIRTYNTGAVGSYQSTSTARYVMVGVPVNDSVKFDLTLLTNRDAATLAMVKAYVSSYPDIEGMRVTNQHEADNPSKNITPALFVSGSKVFIEVVNQVNLTRVHPIKYVSTLMAYMLQNGFPHGNPDLWYVDTAHELGWDCYGSLQINLAAAYSAAKGKPWIMPEWGYQADSSSNPFPTDAQLLARMKNDSGVIKGLANRPGAVCVMNHGAQAMGASGPYPLSTAFWHGLSG